MYFFIPKYNYDIYATMIICALIFSYSIIYVNLRNNNIAKKDIIKSILLSLTLMIVFGKILMFLYKKDINKILFTTAIYAYGCAVGHFIALFLYQKLFPKTKDLFIKYYILVMPLMYSISKLGCFLIGCCRGIRYNGIFSVSYYNNFGPYFPIQLVETIVFFIIFILCNVFKNNKYYIYFITILCATAKFLLDYLRIAHSTEFISTNQKLSLILIFITIILFIKKTKFQKN